MSKAAQIAYIAAMVNAAITRHHLMLA